MMSQALSYAQIVCMILMVFGDYVRGVLVRYILQGSGQQG